jgi:hypothetical protein
MSNDMSNKLSMTFAFARVFFLCTYMKTIYLWEMAKFFNCCFVTTEKLLMIDDHFFITSQEN